MANAIFHHDVKCPHCGFMSPHMLPSFQRKQLEIVTCNSEEGGCDKDFVIEHHAVAQHRALKIEGLE